MLLQLQLWNGLKARVAEVTETDFQLDWNPVGAGTSLVSPTISAVYAAESSYERGDGGGEVLGNFFHEMRNETNEGLCLPSLRSDELSLIGFDELW